MLTGTLDDFTLTDVLRLVASARRTGRLDVTRDAGSGRLWFRDGAVAGADADYERRRPGDAPQRAIEDLTFDLMRWDLGEFTWSPGPPRAGDTATAVEVDELLRDVSRRLEELAEIVTLVPSEEAVLSMAAQPPEGAVQINITPAEWRVLVLVDGRRPVREIAAVAGLDDLEAMKVLFGLAAAGLVQTGTPVPSPEEGAFGATSDLTDMTATSDVSDAPGEETYAAGEATSEAEDPRLPEEFAAAPLPLAPADTAPAVDRSTAARELAGLFAADAPEGFPSFSAAGPPAPPEAPRRVEDDDLVTRGLISRLIDGVKGL